MSTKAKKEKNSDNSYLDSIDLIGGDVAAMFESDANYTMLDLEQIYTVEQVRKTFENDEQSLSDLAESIKQDGLIQPILVRPVGDKYEVVAGERRLMATKQLGETKIKALVRNLTDEEAERIQFSENIHRLNLSLNEEAVRVQKDLDELGSIEAVMEKHKKGRAWISKMLSLLNLPEETQRLVSERISADLEVINAVKVIEKTDKKAAKKVVDDLKATKGTGRAREKVAEAKEKVKPKKDKKAEKSDGVVATVKDRAHEEPGAVNIIRQDKGADYIFSAEELLENDYDSLAILGMNTAQVVERYRDVDRQAVDEYLEPFFNIGKNTNNVMRAVIEGFRKKEFAVHGAKAVALAAFLLGVESQGEKNASYSLLLVFRGLEK